MRFLGSETMNILPVRQMGAALGVIRVESRMAFRAWPGRVCALRIWGGPVGGRHWSACLGVGGGAFGRP